MCFLGCLHALLSSTLQVTCFLGMLTYPIAVHVTGDVFLVRVDIPQYCTRYRWCVSCACWHTPLLCTLQVMCFLGVLTYPNAVHVTGDVFPGCVDISQYCTRYRWCVSWVYWHIPILYTLQVMCFLGVFTYPIAVHVTGDVFPGCVHIPHCCARYRWCFSWVCWCCLTCWLWSRRSPLSALQGAWRKFCCTETSPHSAAHDITDYCFTESPPKTKIPHSAAHERTDYRFTESAQEAKSPVYAQHGRTAGCSNTESQIKSTQCSTHNLNWLLLSGITTKTTSPHNAGQNLNWLRLSGITTRQQVHITQHTEETIAVQQNRHHWQQNKTSCSTRIIWLLVHRTADKSANRSPHGRTCNATHRVLKSETCSKYFLRLFFGGEGDICLVTHSNYWFYGNIQPVLSQGFNLNNKLQAQKQ